MKKIFAIVLACALAMTTLASCTAPTSSTPPLAPTGSTPSGTSEPAAADTITMLLPPVSTTYQEQLAVWAKDFNTLYPNLTLEFETASWEDYKQKLDVQINAGSPPDIAFVEYDRVGTLADTGLLVDISKMLTPEQLADFDDSALDFYRLNEGLYGLPIYISVQCLGGNQAMLEEAKIDWKKIQKEGWTFEEFSNAIKTGTKDGRYGFIFACAGVTAVDYLNIMSKNAGMPAPFDENLKYAYTSKNFLELLKSLRQVIDDGSTPKEMSSIDGGKRWNMFLTGQTMIFGKGLANFESLAKANNAKIQAKDGTAVENSKEAEYVVLPVPTFFGNKQNAQGAASGYSMFRGKQEPTPEHQANVLKAMMFMSTAEQAAFTCNELYLSGLSNSTREAMDKITNEVPRSTENAEAMAYLTANAAKARPDIPAELSAKAARMLDEVVVPKFQALLANEATPEQMYDAVKKAAIEIFGEDGIVKD